MPKKIGPTGTFPDGRLGAADKGEIDIDISVVNERVVINFGTGISWLAMNAAQAMALAEGIALKARELQS